MKFYMDKISHGLNFARYFAQIVLLGFYFVVERPSYTFYAGKFEKAV